MLPEQAPESLPRSFGVEDDLCVCVIEKARQGVVRAADGIVFGV